MSNERSEAEKNLRGQLRDAVKAATEAAKKVAHFESMADAIATKLRKDHGVEGLKIDGEPRDIVIRNGAERREAKKAGQPIPDAVYGLATPKVRDYGDD